MKRASTIALGALAVFALVLPIWLPLPARVAYNASASAPLGWYRIDATAAIKPNDYVLVRLPPAIAMLAEQRGYLPSHIPLLKRVAAMAGTAVCVRHDVLFIDGMPRARLRSHDGQGRALPRWMPCRVLAADELVLLNTEHAASFDSRYFGPVSLRALRGKAVPIWTWRMSGR